MLKPINYIRNQLRSESAQNVLILTSGFSVAQAIPIISMIALTWLYPEESFGIFFIYSSTNIILSIIATLRFQMSVVLPDNDDSAFHLLITSILIALVMSLIALIFIVSLHEWITSMFKEKQLGTWLYFLPLSMFISGVFDSTNFWFNRKKQFKKISTARILRNLFLSVSQIVFGLLKQLTIGLIGGLLIGQFASAAINFHRVFKEEKHRFRLLPLKKHLTLIKTYRNIPLFNTSISMVNSLSQQLPIFLLSNFYGVVIAGYYGLAYRVTLPMSMFGQSVGQVFYQKASDWFNQGENLHALVKKTYLKLFKFGLVPFVFIMLFAPIIFRFLFGDNWETAGKYAQILIPFLFLSFLTAPVSYIVTVLNKQRKLTFYEIVLLISRFLALWTGYKIWEDVVYSIVLYAGVGILFNLFLLFYYLRISKTTITLPQNEGNLPPGQ